MSRPSVMNAVGAKIGTWLATVGTMLVAPLMLIAPKWAVEAVLIASALDPDIPMTTGRFPVVPARMVVPPAMVALNGACAVAVTAKVVEPANVTGVAANTRVSAPRIVLPVSAGG